MSSSLLVLLLAASARADFPTTQPYQSVTYTHDWRPNPPTSLYVVTIDLSDPGVKVRVIPGGADPDGPGPWQTTLMTVRQIAEREKTDVTINASFFGIYRPTTAPIPEEVAEKSGKPATTQSTQQTGYRAGVWSKALGWSMTDGKLWAPEPNRNWPIVWVDDAGKVRIGQPQTLPPNARQVVTGNCFLLREGKVAEMGGMMNVRHPRTAIGVSKNGTRLVLLTVDGRRPPVSVGMTGEELAAEMQRLGCWDAINLDGGGSTTLVMRDPETGEQKVINQPSDNRERPVANVVGVDVTPGE